MVLLVVMSKKEWLAIEILMIACVSYAAPLEADLGGISNFFQKLNPTVDNLSTAYENIDDYETYRQKKAEQGLTSLCWTESIIITEDKRSNTKNMSKAYSIILESMADSGEHTGENHNTSCYKLEGDDDIKRERIFNFTTVKETDVYSIKEHKTLFCGAGPVLSEHFIVWPKLNRKRIEISISPMTSTKWRTCKEDTVEQSDILGSAFLSDNNSVFENSEEQDVESDSVIDESPLQSTKDSYDSNYSSSLNLTEPSRVAMSKNRDDKTPKDIGNSLIGSKENTLNNTSNRTQSDWSESSSVGSRKETENPMVESNSSIQLQNASNLQNYKKDVSEEGNSDAEESVGKAELDIGKKFKKVTKKDTFKNQKEPREYTTKNSMEMDDIREKKEGRELSNTLLDYKINCNSINESICHEILTKSSFIAEFQNKNATLANLFFPKNTLLHLFRDADNNSYSLNVEVVLDLKISDPKSKMGDDRGIYLVMDEKSEYQFRKHIV